MIYLAQILYIFFDKFKFLYKLIHKDWKYYKICILSEIINKFIKMNTFEIKNINSDMLYLSWKILNNKHRNWWYPDFEKENLKRILENYKGWFIDDFDELAWKYTKTELFLNCLYNLINIGLIEELIIRIERPWEKEPYFKPLEELTINFSKNNINQIYDYWSFYTNWNYNTNKTDLFLKWFYSIWKNAYLFYFVYKPNFDLIEEYIQEYLLLWWNDKLIKPDNYIIPKRQIAEFNRILEENYHLYGDEFNYSVWLNNNLDEITLLLYLNITWYINLLEFEDWIDRFFWLNKNTGFKFKIEITEKFISSLKDDFITEVRIKNTEASSNWINFKIVENSDDIIITNALYPSKNTRIKTTNNILWEILKYCIENNVPEIEVKTLFNNINKKNKDIQSCSQSFRDSRTGFYREHLHKLGIDKEIFKNIINIKRTILSFNMN